MGQEVGEGESEAREDGSSLRWVGGDREELRTSSLRLAIILKHKADEK